MSNESINDFGLYFIGRDTSRYVDTYSIADYTSIYWPYFSSIGSGHISLPLTSVNLGEFEVSLPQVPPRLMEQSTENVWYIEPDFSYVTGLEVEFDMKVEEYPFTTADNVVLRIAHDRSTGRIFVGRLTEEQPMSSDPVKFKIAQKDPEVPPEFTVIDGRLYYFAPNAWIGKTSGLCYVNVDESAPRSPTGFNFDPDVIRQIDPKVPVDGTLNQLLNDGWITEIVTVPRAAIRYNEYDLSSFFFSFGKVEFED